MPNAPLQVVPPPPEPLTRDEARARLRALQGEPNASQLARDWKWPRTNVRRLIAACRKEGVIAPSARQRKMNPAAKTNRKATPVNAGPQPAKAVDSAPPAVPSTKKLTAMPSVIELPSPDIRTPPRADDDLDISITPAANENKRDAPERASFADNFVSYLLRATGIVLGMVGLVLNTIYYSSMGRTHGEALMLAIVGAMIDLMMMTLLMVAGNLWDRRRRGAAGVSFTVWLFAVLMSFLASNGFTSNNILDTVRGREKATSESAALTAKLDQLRRDRASIAETRSPAAIESSIQREQPRIPAANWNSSAGCTNVTAATSGKLCATINALREARAQAERRDRLDADIAKTETGLHDLPAYASADPGADMSSKLLSAGTLGLLNITPENVQTIRIAGLTLAPLSSALLLFFAGLTWRERREDDEHDAPIV
jgi:hypothetical protein